MTFSSVLQKVLGHSSPNDVKWPVLQLYGQREHFTQKSALLFSFHIQATHSYQFNSGGSLVEAWLSLTIAWLRIKYRNLYVSVVVNAGQR